MVQIVTVDLAARGIAFPPDRVGMVVAQPRLSLTAGEPYQCTPAARAQQLALITRTLALARECPHGAQKTHFTLFPEFSVPGLAGIDEIDAALQAANWPDGTVVIAGIDGLLKSDYATLTARPNTFVDASNAVQEVADDQWINCIITWIKGANQTVERWVQPKIWPSRIENDAQFQRMFRGRSIYLFKGMYANNAAPYRFSSLVCFDWIATVGAYKPWQWLLTAMQQEAAGMQATLPLTWLFVIQHNEQPSHPTFLTELPGFYNQNVFPAVHRQGTCLVFANNAGADRPGRAPAYGCTSLVFAQAAQFTPPECYFTYSNGGQKARGNDLVRPNREAVFREKGPCIHSFLQINPASLGPGAAGHSLPVESPFVFPINAADIGPRTPGGVVPAAVKWINDSLDELPCLSAAYHAHPLAPAVHTAHSLNAGELRSKAAAAAAKVLSLACPAFTKEKPGSSVRVDKHADEWDTAETQGLEHVVHTLDMLRIAFTDTATQDTDAHAGATIRGQPVDIIAVRGSTHGQCLQHADKSLSHPRRKLLIVSRDDLNSALSSRDGSFLRTNQPKLTARAKFNDPGSNRIHLGFQELLEHFLSANTAAELEGGVHGRLAN